MLTLFWHYMEMHNSRIIVRQYVSSLTQYVLVFQVPAACSSCVCGLSRPCLPNSDIWHVQQGHASSHSLAAYLCWASHCCNGGVLHNVSGWAGFMCLNTGSDLYFLLVLILTKLFFFLFFFNNHRSVSHRTPNPTISTHPERWHAGWGASSRHYGHLRRCLWRDWSVSGPMRHCASSRIGGPDGWLCL